MTAFLIFTTTIFILCLNALGQTNMSQRGPYKLLFYKGDSTRLQYIREDREGYMKMDINNDSTFFIQGMSGGHDIVTVSVGKWIVERDSILLIQPSDTASRRKADEVKKRMGYSVYKVHILNDPWQIVYVKEKYLYKYHGR